MNNPNFQRWRNISLSLAACFFIGCFSCDERETPSASSDTGTEASVDSATAQDVRPTAADGTTPLPDAKREQPDTTANLPDIASDGRVSDTAAQTEKSNLCTGAYGPVETSSILASDSLKEISGLVASSTSSEFFWAHNDSGDTARLYALHTDGSIQQEVLLQDVTAIDFEDIARSVCPDGTSSCLWIADTGNNLRNRETLVVYVVEEPDLAESPLAPTAEIPLKAKYLFQYPDGVHDAEALVVSPDGTAFWIFEKSGTESARIYRGSTALDADATQTLTTIATIPSPGFPVNMGRMITGADLHPGGERIAIRVYTGTYEYRLSTPLGFEEMQTRQPLQVCIGPIDELQGEAVAYAHDGISIWTCSEDPTGAAPQPLHFYPCLESSP